jgi:hypothetical protein
LSVVAPTTAAIVRVAMTATETRIDPALQAAWQVMIREIEWFETLDDDMLRRIADLAPPDRPEHVYATTVLTRRARNFSSEL